MPNRSWRSGNNKQPPQQREKKTLEDTCLDLKKSVTSEHKAREDAAKRELERVQEDEQMRLTYGPNWKQGLPQWAADRDKVQLRASEPEGKGKKGSPYKREEEESDDDAWSGERVIPFDRGSGVRLKNRRAS